MRWSWCYLGCTIERHVLFTKISYVLQKCFVLERCTRGFLLHHKYFTGLNIVTPQVKPLLGMPASHTRVLGKVLATLPLMQLPADRSGKTVEIAQVLGILLSSQSRMEIRASGLSLSQLLLVAGFGGVSRWVEGTACAHILSLCPCLSLCREYIYKMLMLTFHKYYSFLLVVTTHATSIRSGKTKAP